MSAPETTPEPRLPRGAAGVRRGPAGRLADTPGVRAAFADPCAGAESYEDWLACQAAQDPFILY